MNDIEEQIKELLEKNNCRLKYRLSFPRYNILPDEVKLALKILGKNGMNISIEVEEKMK